MTTAQRLNSLALRFDKALTKLDRAAIKRLNYALTASYRNLEDVLRGLYSSALSDAAGNSQAFAEARARVLIAQLQTALDITSSLPETQFSETLVNAYARGLDDALEAISIFDRDVLIATSQLPVDVIAQATNAYNRLRGHGRDFARTAERVIIDGIIRGQGYSKTASQLRKQTGIVKRAAMTIVRTETVTAANAARLEQYKASGIDYVQWIATADDRVCGYCASRAGNVYKRADAVLPLHPNDRCYLAPWKQDWQDRGLTDDDWFKEHRMKTIERSYEDVKTGPAPFEQARGLDVPVPFWGAA